MTSEVPSFTAGPASRGIAVRPFPPAARPRLLLLCCGLLVLGLGLASLVRAPGVAHAAALPFNVNDTRDRVDSNIGDGICRTGGNTCTLRAAIQEANASFGHDTINLPAAASPYAIELPPANHNGPENGDFDITDSVSIIGAGAGSAIIDGGNPPAGASPERRGLDRLLEVHVNAGDVAISGVTLRNGYSAEMGGAVQNWSLGRLRLDGVHVLDSWASKSGGGVNNGEPREWRPPDGSSWNPPENMRAGRVEIAGSRLAGNGAGETGAAVNNESNGTVAILDGTVVEDNPGSVVEDPQDPGSVILADPDDYPIGAGAVANQAEGDAVGSIRVADSRVSDNTSTYDGAGILNAGDGSVVVERSTIEGNRTEGNGGGIYSDGGNLTVTGSTLDGNHAAGGGGIHTAGEVSSVGLRGRVELRASTLSGNSASDGSGGGMSAEGDAQLAIADTAFEDNETEDAGGGLTTEGRSSLVMTRTKFDGNASTGDGGGAHIATERLVRIEDSAFLGNSAGTSTGPDPQDANGGGLFSETGRVDVKRSKFNGNTATEEGGGIMIDNFGDVTVADSEIRNNRAVHTGGGVENSAMRVVFERLTVAGNVAGEEGGGVHNSSSGEFSILDSTIETNRAVSGGGFTNASDSTLIIRGSLFTGNSARRPSAGPDVDEDAGLGGGIFSISDGAGLIENTTLSGNTANVGGGGMFHDADAGMRLNHVTVTRNSAPLGSGIGVVESDFVPSVPPQPQDPALRNTIVAGNRNSPDCDAMLTSQGGNLDGGTGCAFNGPRDRSNTKPRLDALADNGGLTLTHALRQDSPAVDRGVSPCPETDARGVKRPLNRGCDVGAYEYEGPFLPPDQTPPETEYLSGPIQDSLETMAFRFTGSDDTTPEDELAFECRVVENDLTEEPDIQPPWAPLDPALMFQSCASPWSTKLEEEGLFTFEVRAIDNAGNVDPTPALHTYSAMDNSPPDTIIVEKPPNPSSSRGATFTFSGTDNVTPPEFLEYECRLDSRDPDHWVECVNPTFFSNLTTGSHTLEVRATDAADLVDPTPARYTWTIGPPETCDQANVTLTAAADAWVDERTPLQNHLFDQELTVRSAVGENARALFRFALPDDASHCKLESATLRLHAGSSTPGRTLEATPLAGSWRESQVTWHNQPSTQGTPARTSSGDGYRTWNVLSHVEGMLESGTSHGWQIRDADENDPDGGDQSFGSREVIQDPPENTLPQLVLRYEADDSPPPPAPDPPDPDDPKRVHCGQVLKESTLVGNDLTNCPGEGLVIGAPNIVVDLDGHTIDGPDYLAQNQSGQEEGMPAGIRNSGHTNVVIRNGTVQQFGYGVLLTPSTTRTVVEDLTILRNALAGVHLFDADDGRTGNTIQDSTISENEVGVEMFADTESNVVRRNVMHGNLGEAVHLHLSGGNRIEDNDVVGIPVDPTLDSDGGMLLEGSSNNVISGNRLHDTGDAGVGVYQSSHANRIADNVMYRNGDAGVVIGDSDRNEVINLTSHQQSDGGVVLNDANDTTVRGSDLRFNPSGVESSNSNHVVIEDNDVSHSLQDGLDLASGVNMRVVDNVASQTGAAGISLEGAVYGSNGQPVGGAVIEGNTANQNMADGINVSEGGHRIARNDAHNNAGHGIAAESDAIDGGGNRASGNAKPEQCVNVVCDIGMSVPRIPDDTTAPKTEILSAPPEATSTTSATFTFAATDAGTPATAMRYECRLDGGPDPEPDPEPEPDPNEPPPINQEPDTNDPPDGEGWFECTSPIHFHDLDPGEHRFEVRAIDQADNKERPAVVHEWRIDLGEEDDEDGPDTLPPNTRIAAAPSDPSYSSAATFRFAGSDNATPGARLRFQCRLDSDVDTAWEDCESPKTYSGLDEGEHTFEVRAIDRTGNVDPTPATHKWTVTSAPGDTEAPDTSIDSHPDPTTVRTSARFGFSADEDGARFECSLDGGPFTECSSPKEYSGIGVGNHEFRVRAVDEAGNADETPATFNWTIGAAPVPTVVFCGQVITRSTLVLNDLSNCLQDGLVVGAHGITIDLGDRTFDGVGLGAGVRNDGYDSVTVRNGTIREFDYGVSMNTGTELNIAEELRLESNQEGPFTLGLPVPPQPNQVPPAPVAGSVKDNTIRDNELVGNKRGIWLAHGTRGNLVRGNSLGATDGPGVWLETANDNRIEGNTIDRSSGPAIELRGASRNVIAENELSDNDKGGVYVGPTVTGTTGLPSNDNRVERNTMEEGGGLEVVGSKGNQLIDNVANGSDKAGLALDNATETLVRGNDLRSNKSGITLKASSKNHLEGNNASRSGDTGITLGAQSLSNVLLKNTSSDTQGDGISVGDETAAGSGTRIEGNSTHNNKSRGIYVGKPSHTIKGNSANDNGSWGIWVSDASNGRVNVDGGGNRAQGNVGPFNPFTGEYDQCYGVRCDGSGPSDQTPPTTSIIDGPPSTTLEDSATFRFTGSDNVSSVEFECRLDSDSDSDWAPCRSPHTVAVDPGSHTFEVRAVDGSGNADPTPAKHTWTVLEPPPGAPDTKILSGPDASTVSTTATFDFSSDRRNVKFECALDEGSWVACNLVGVPDLRLAGGTPPVTFKNLSVGSHEFRVRAVNSSGEPDPSPAVWAWTIEPPPVASEVECGEVVTQSTRVLNDLAECPGHGLVIGAPRITIDLDGHVIDGRNLDAGILNPGHDYVTVTNGTIQQFDYGVMLTPRTALNVVSDLRLEGNQDAGIGLSDADQGGQGNTVRHNTLVSNGFGMVLNGGTAHQVIRDNALGGNNQQAIRVEFSGSNRIQDNEIANSGGAGVVLEGGSDNVVVGNEITGINGAGIAVGAEEMPADGTRVEANTVSASNGGGIHVTASTGTRVLYNEVHDSNGGGVGLELARNTEVRGNDLRGNKSGIALDASSGNRLEANNTGDSLGTGIELEQGSVGNAIVLNASSNNSGEGIHVVGSAPAGLGNLLERNVASSNGGDGISVEGAGHTITANTVESNGGWGIYAPLGATDGGGNLAAGNAEAQQCLGVVCSIGEVPGAPDTEIVTKPSNPSNSRNASFTYTGHDDNTPLHEMQWECRLDSTSELAWEDCDYPQEYLNLLPGQHTFEIRAIDRDGKADPTPARYTWTYEPLPAGVAPEVTIDEKPEKESWVFDALFTFHANEPDVTFQCRVDSMPYQPCGFQSAMFMSRGAFEWSFEDYEVGKHTFQVRAIDFEGNVGQPATYEWRIMGVITEFLSGPGFTPSPEPGEPATGGPVRDTTATIDFRANVSDATYECSLDLGPFEPCTPPVTYTNLAPGEHSLRVIATDLATGVEEEDYAEYEWEVVAPFDNTPPDTSIERAPAPSGSSSTIFEFTGSDDQTPTALLRYQCRLDSDNPNDWFDCESPLNLLDHYTYADPQMAPGQHTFEVRAVDTAEPLVADPTNPDFEGNVDPTPARHTWIALPDTTPPGTGISSGPPPRTGDIDAEFEFFGTDNATPAGQMTFECSVDGGDWQPCDSPESVQGLEPGEHTFRVRARDLRGNVDATPATRTWTIVPAPVVSIDSAPPAEGSTGEQAVVEFSADQAGSTFECSFNGAPFERCKSPAVLSVTSPGTQKLEIRATNPEGIVGPIEMYEWRVELGPDTTPPNTTITGGPAPSSSQPTATFQFHGTDNRTSQSNMKFECSLDGAPFEECDSPHEVTGLGRGEHVFRVRAIDQAGNADASPAEYRWTVAGSPPRTTIHSGPEDPTESSEATFEFSSDVPGSTFTCWMSAATPKLQPCTSPVTYTDVPPGEHTFAVYATDPDGVNESDWVEYEWEVGHLTAPVTTIQSGPDQQTEETSATFTFDSGDLAATYECRLDGGDWRACESPTEYTRLALGQHRFEVRALKLGLLVDPITTAHEWTVVDLTPPDTEIEFGPPATTSSTTARFGFSSDESGVDFECSIDGEAFSSCESPVEYTDLARTSHTFAVRAIDGSGNADPTPATYQWMITDPPPPNTPLGTDVTVELPMPDVPGVASVTFGEVSTLGTTVIDRLIGAPTLPSGYSQAGARYYELTTTVNYNDPLTVCLAYDAEALAGSAVRLLELDGSVWNDITQLNDRAGARVCGEAEELTAFAVVRATAGVAPLVSITSTPPSLSTSGSATFEFEADQPDAVLACSIDGQPFEPCSSPVTYHFLESGGHKFEVQAISLFGFPGQTALYEWDVELPPDTTPPETQITKPTNPNLMTTNLITTFEFTGSDDQTHPLELDFECSLNGGPFNDCDSPEEIQVDTAGQHRLEVRAIDMAGNVDPTPAVFTWTVIDLRAPDTEIISGPNSETSDTTATFEFEGETPDGTPVNEFDCRLDSGDWEPCTSPHTVENLSVGPHVLQVRARDASGNVDWSPDSYEWTVTGPVDTTPPDTMIIVAPPAVSGPDVTFGFMSNEWADPELRFQCSLDGGAFSDCESVHQLDGLAGGQHTLRVRAIDGAGNIDATPASHTWTVVGPPQTTITSGPANGSTVDSVSATFEFTSSYEGATFECSSNGSAWVPCTSPHTVGPATEDGEQEFEVRAVTEFTYRDGERVLDESPATRTWIVGDVSPPETTEVTVNEIGPGGENAEGDNANTIRFQWSGTDDRTAPLDLEFECQLDGGQWESCDSPYYLELEGLSAGSHTFRIRAVDEVGNVEATPHEYTFSIEQTPQTSITATPQLNAQGQTESRSATFEFGSDTPFASFECRLDPDNEPVPFLPCSSPVTFSDLALGEHVLEVRAVGVLGSHDPTPERFEWEIGYLTAPQVTIDSGPGDPDAEGVLRTTATEATIEFSSPDPDARFRCSLDGAPFTFCSSPVELSGLEPGREHTFEVEATKAHLLVDELSAEHVWFIDDLDAPDTEITSGPPALTASREAVFEFTGTDNATAPADLDFECSLNGAPFESCDSPHEVQSLEPGVYELQVRAVDQAGNADRTPATHGWTVVAAPNTEIVSGPESPSASTTASFEFSSDQAFATFECSLDGGDFEPCASPHEVSGLTPGDHRLEVRATSGFGIVDETPALHEWTVELSAAPAPDTTITSGPSDRSGETSASFEFAADQEGSSYECKLDARDWEACTSPAGYSDLIEGDHTFQVRATNSEGTVEETPAVYRWTIDLPPETMIESGPPSRTARTAQFEFASNDPQATFECSLERDPGAEPTSPEDLSWGSCPRLHEYKDQEAGSYRLYVRAKDGAGNVDPMPATHDWTVVAAPETTITSAPEDPTDSRDATFEFESDDPDATFECSLDESDWQPCTSPKAYSNLAFGEHDFAVRAKDAEGNVDPTPADHEWDIGDILGEVSVNSNLDLDADGRTESRSATFELSAQKRDGTTVTQFECRLDNGQWALCTSPRSYSGLTLGEHTFQVRAFSEHAVNEPPVQTVTWTVADLTAPDTTIDAKPASTTGETAANFYFSSSEANSTFRCRIDDEQFEACASPKRYENLELGEHRFEVQAVDSSGNVDPTPASYEWTVVPTPDTAIDSTPPSATEETTATFGFSATSGGLLPDLLATFECKLDIGQWEECASPKVYEDLAVGRHVFDVRAVNEFGIKDPEPARYEWTVEPDTTAPEVTIEAAPEATTTDTAARFAFSASESGSSFECSLDGGDYEACTSPKTYTDLEVGPHEFSVRAIDAAGNIGDEETHSWTISSAPDTTAPEVTLSAKPDATTTSASARFEFTASEDATFECSLDGAGFTDCASPQEYADLSVGQHQFRVRATDAAGNTGDPVSHEWTISTAPDTTAPEVTLGAKPDATTSSTSARFEFSADESGSTFECRLDGGDFGECESPKEYSGLSAGEHTFEVRATDQSGNTSEPTGHTWTIEPPADTTPPEATIDEKPAAETTSTTARFTFSANESGSSFECSLDDAAWGGCTSPKEYTGLSAGTHEFRVRATDPAGNTGQPVSHRWTVQQSCAASTVTVGAAADSWVLQSSANQNYATDSMLKVDTKSKTISRSMVRFNLPTVPAGCVVKSAELRLYASSYKSGRTIQALRLGGTSAWTETGINWNNQPAPVGAAATAPSRSTAGYMQWAVADQVKSMYSSLNNGFLIRDAVESGSFAQGFHSRERNDNPPRLVITFG